jgi:carbon monoxide dehydrogenase subunit G
MAHIQSTLIVHQPVEEVFAFLNARESHLKFIPRMTELNQTSPGVFGQVGTTLSGMLNYFGVRITVHYEIIDIERNQKLALQGKMGPVHFKDGYTLKPNDMGTEINFWLDLIPTGWARIFNPFMSLIGKIHAWETLRNLKRELAEKIATPGRTLSSQ